MRFKTRRSIQMAGGAMLLAGSLFLTGTGGAHAASICRTDPVITLSNGYVISLVDAVPTSANITSVNYALHVPKGVTLTKITFDAFYSVERVTVTGDQTATHYQVVTTTATTKSGVTFTAYVYHGTTTLGSATGKSNGSVTISWIGQ